jgi:hypothetical protein
MLCVGMPSWTLRVFFDSGSPVACQDRTGIAARPKEDDAERRRRHSHAEHGNECIAILGQLSLQCEYRTIPPDLSHQPERAIPPDRLVRGQRQSRES